jgi:hypothetical protein
MKQSNGKNFKASLKTLAKSLLFLAIFSYALINILLSQNISPLYFQVAKENRSAVVDFLSQIKNHPAFASFLTTNQNIYNHSLEQEVFAESIKRKQRIEDYEELLSQNPKSRDILYNLYLLYHEENDELKAAAYLKRAREIDPALNY